MRRLGRIFGKKLKLDAGTLNSSGELARFIP